MRIFTLTTLAILISSSIHIFGQDISQQNTEPSPRFTKGYYSIGDNWKKLRPGITLPVDSVAENNFSKGFYSLDSSSKKLPKKNVWFGGPAKRPVFSKGYYSIGAPVKKDK